MAYRYTFGDLTTMSTETMLEALKNKEIAPRWVVGTGYKDARKVAIEYLTERLEQERASK